MSDRRKIRVLDLFSCIGFHSLGLERASSDFEIVALCEANKRRQQELERLHPGVPIYDDVRTLPVIEADVVFGGPPCQRTSVAAAIHGKRDGHSLWPYMLCAGIDAGAEWFVVEQPTGNAAWEAQVNRQLSRAGYHVARFVFGAEDVGAPYPRRRVYLIACTSLQRLEIAWQAGPSAIERAKGAADARGDWNPDTIPAFNLDTWRAEDVHERRERIQALGDSNPPAMAEVIGLMISDAMIAARKLPPLPASAPTPFTMEMSMSDRSKIDDGGPAYPFVSWQTPDGMTATKACDGMTLRDHFAGQALAGMGAWTPLDSREWSHRDEVQRVRAEWAYEQADAMIRARKLPTT